MAHGIKPYGRTQSQDTVYGLQDMGELAARLGSPVTFDRRGNVIWYDNFESGVEGWFRGPAGFVGTLTWSSLYHRNGGFCAQLATGAVLNNTMEMWRHSPYPVASRFGLEVSFSHDWGIDQFVFHLMVDTLANYWVTAIRYDTFANTLEYWDNAGAWIPFAAGLLLMGAPTLFHTVKLVIDPLTGLYSYCILNGLVYNLAAIPMQDVGAGVAPRLLVGIEILDNNPGARPTWIDDVIATQNEP